MEKFVQGIWDNLGSVVAVLITIESVLILGCIIFVTEFIKQYVKNRSKMKSSNWKPLANYEIRGVSAIVGILFTYIFIDGLTLKLIFGYGIFYGGFSFVAYWFFKKYVVAKFSDDLNNKMSGQ